MKPYYTQFSAPKTTYTGRVYGVAPDYVPRMYVAVSQQPTVSVVRSLTCADQTSNGDRKKPKPQTYLAVRENKLQGAVWTTYPGSSNFDNVIGPFPYSLYGQSPNVGNDPNVYNEALGKLYEKVRGSVDLTTDLFQWRQTAGMVSGAKKVLAKTRDAILTTRKLERLLQSSHFRDRRRGRNWNAAFERRYRDDISKKIADVHLQWQYGVKPTMYTVYGLIDEFRNQPENWLVLESRAKSTVTTRRNDGNLTGLGVDSVRIYTRTKRVEIKCRFALAPSHLDNISRISSLNPASVLWELMPYSFVVDWVYDVGSYLRNVESALLYGSSFLDGYVTYTNREVGNVSVEGTYDGGYWGKTTVSLKGDYQHTYKQRSVLGVAPFPKAPRLNANLGSGQLLNGAALLRQLIRGNLLR